MVRAARMGTWIAALAIALVLACAGSSAAQEPEVTVSKDQIVSLSGSSPSLHGVIQKLCALSGVELRQYEAEDRKWTGNYQAVPLAELLPRLLRTESYAVGMKSGASAPPRIAWVRVMGAKTGSPSSLVAAPPPPTPMPPPTAPVEAQEASAMPPDQAATVLAAMLRPALSVDNEDARKLQVDRLVAKLSEMPDAKMMLKLADPTAVAHSLAAIPGAREGFAAIQSGIHDPEVQRQLNAIAGAMNGIIARMPPPEPQPEAVE
jgi:hypothetical protein